MNLPLFIANRTSSKEQGTFSGRINRVAVITISIGLFSLLLAFMFLGGFQSEIKEKIYSFAGHILVSRYTISSSYEESAIEVNEAMVQELMQTPEVRHFQYYALKAGLLKTEEEVQGVIFKGVDHTFDSAYFSRNLKEGRLPNLYDADYTTEVVISTQIARLLKLQVGDKVPIYFVQNPPRFRNLTIVGLYETYLEEFDKKIILGDLGLVQRLNDWTDKQVAGVEVFLHNDNNIDAVHEDLYDRLDMDLYVETVEQNYLQFFDWFSMINRNVLILLVLILLVACFSMVSILLILIMERTQMVGLLKSLGSENGQIRSIFVISGVRLILRGMLIGNAAALGFCALQYYFHLIPLDPVNYYIAFIPVEFNWTVILGVNLLTAVVISLSLFIPVAIVNRIQPIKAIRFD